VKGSPNDEPPVRLFDTSITPQALSTLSIDFMADAHDQSKLDAGIAFSAREAILTKLGRWDKLQ
jgi:hypothetical protein